MIYTKSSFVPCLKSGLTLCLLLNVFLYWRLLLVCTEFVSELFMYGGGEVQFRCTAHDTVGCTQGRMAPNAPSMYYTVCPRSLDRFYVVIANIKLGQDFLDEQYKMKIIKIQTTAWKLFYIFYCFNGQNCICVKYKEHGIISLRKIYQKIIFTQRFFIFPTHKAEHQIISLGQMILKNWGRNNKNCQINF